MKKLFFIITLTIAVAACKKDSNPQAVPQLKTDSVRVIIKCQDTLSFRISCETQIGSFNNKYVVSKVGEYRYTVNVAQSAPWNAQEFLEICQVGKGYIDTLQMYINGKEACNAIDCPMFITAY